MIKHINNDSVNSIGIYDVAFYTKSLWKGASDWYGGYSDTIAFLRLMEVVLYFIRMIKPAVMKLWCHVPQKYPQSCPNMWI